MLNEEIFLNPNEPNPGFMVHKDEARKVLLKAIAGKSECFWILGKTGIGKTTFLLWLNEFAPVYRVEPILIHGGEKLTLDEVKTKVEQTIKPSFFSRVFLRKKALEYLLILFIMLYMIIYIHHYIDGIKLASTCEEPGLHDRQIL